jgi:hypothetical protein
MYHKKETTKNGPPRTKEEATFRWLWAWNCLPQDRIQQWIKQIPQAIKEIICPDGGNEYIESHRRRERCQRGNHGGQGSNYFLYHNFCNKSSDTFGPDLRTTGREGTLTSWEGSCESHRQWQLSLRPVSERSTYLVKYKFATVIWWQIYT